MTCLDPAACNGIRDELAKWGRREAREFWRDNEAAILDLPTDELHALAANLRRGDTFAAYHTLVSTAPLDVFRALRQETTAMLEHVAVRRAAMMEALRDLGRRAAKLLGRLIQAALRAATGMVGL